ncbi:MAG: tetratricopeptide repeat protein [Candidatus Undinarchaeales archaeon]|nr:tetratricopeptide repeat protein [Candidatus Undinarchaeales archaeon]MDP7491408.1 tetratricopeptide repeat protein [Candidatus Undinarchaeales archaeon]
MGESTTDIEELLRQGKDAFEEGRVGVAIERFKDVLSRDPDDPTALNNLGSCLVRAGRFEDAVRAFSEALEVDATRPETLLNLATALERLVFEKGRDDHRALWVRTLESLTLVAPDNPDIWIDLGVALGGTGEGAEKCFRRVLSLELGRPEAAERLGEALIAREAFDEAEVVYRELVERDPKSVLGWAGLGIVAFRQTKPSSAEEHLRRALKLDRDHEKANRGMALVLEATGRPDLAILHEEACGMLAPENVPDAWATAGMLLEGRGETARARRCFSRERLYRDIMLHEATARLRPDDAEVVQRLAELYAAYGDERRAAAWRERIGNAAEA